MEKNMTVRELIEALNEVEEDRKDLPIYVYELGSGSRFSINIDGLDDSMDDYLDINCN